MKSLFKKICIASDHAGYKTKEHIKNILVKNEISVIDLGPYNENSVDYPDYAKKVRNRIKAKRSDIGILICGSGTGMAISANKSKDIRAAVCYNSKSTYLSRAHNNANIICLGARMTKKNTIVNNIKIFLKTRFECGRHVRRIKKL